MSQASTFDFVILDATLTHRKYQEDKIAGKLPNIDEDVMKQAIKSVKQQ
jgi:hypothetical protein